ncbi:MAG: 6-carboxytetrahydropterin synthase QueD [Candidatus Edwardsbacteria bacterium]
MFEIKVETSFSAGHHLRGYRGSCERPHGHNWKVAVTIEKEKINRLGIIYDFRRLKRELEKVVSVLDHQDLNTLPQFKKENPSSENIARWIYLQLKPQIKRGRVKEIQIWESQGTSVIYREE